LIDEQLQAAKALTPVTREQLFDVLRVDTDAPDMAELVRSVTEPGLKQRIANYLAER
jgi:hypothetical protein